MYLPFITKLNFEKSILKYFLFNSDVALAYAKRLSSNTYESK